MKNVLVLFTLIAFLAGCSTQSQAWHPGKHSNKMRKGHNNK